VALPRVLFVSRERHRLPLDDVQRHKWDAIGERLDYRVFAAAPPGFPTRSDRFHLVGPRSPRAVDGAIFYLRLPFRLGRELRESRPDAAFVQGVHELVALLAARRITAVPTKAILDLQGDWHAATRLYGSSWRRLLDPLNDAIGTYAVRHADAVRVLSGHTGALVRGAGVDPAACFPPYVDAEAFLRLPVVPLPEQPTALFVGVLERYKNIDGLAAAWPLVTQRVVGAQLRLVGNGTRTDIAESLVRDHGATWDRTLDAEGVAAAMDDSWLLVLPSRAEGLGRVLIEAACRGRALVGADRGGIPDVVADGVNGVLVDPDDPRSLADALVRLLSDRREAERLGAAARETGEQWSITPEQFADRIAAVVGSALSH
jgi:glycosyltransferase involved in cell wall biosynthesis